MENKEIDNEKLLLEIESLDDENYGNAKIKQNKNKNFSILMVTIFLLGLSILYFGNYNEIDILDDDEYTNEEISSYAEKEEIMRNKFETEQKNNITVKDTFFSHNKELIFLMSNNNDEPITDLKVGIAFYNEKEELIKIDLSNIEIIDNHGECYVKFFNTPENFERYDFVISKEYYWYNNLEYVTDKIFYEVEEKGDTTNIIVKNNYSKDISEVDFQIIYYDENNNVLDVENVFVSELKKNQKQKQELYLTLWKNKTYDSVNYDRYEVKLIGAYIY